MLEALSAKKEIFVENSFLEEEATTSDTKISLANDNE